MSYARHALMVAPARKYPALWRLVLGIASLAVLTAGFAVALFLAIRFLLTAEQSITLFASLGGGSIGPGSTILALLLIAGMFPATLIAARFWQKRAPRTLFGPGALALRHFSYAALLTFVVMITILVILLPLAGRPVPNLEFGLWLRWLPIALLALVFQTGAEEVLFRGYLQSQLAARFKSPAIWMILPALGFASLHITPDLSPVFFAVMLIGSFLFGLMAADLTARTGTLGAAWGFHFANNVLALLIISSDSSFAGLSLYLAAEPVNEMTGVSPVLLADVLAISAVWLVLRRVLTA